MGFNLYIFLLGRYESENDKTLSDGNSLFRAKLILGGICDVTMCRSGFHYCLSVQFEDALILAVNNIEPGSNYLSPWEIAQGSFSTR